MLIFEWALKVNYPPSLVKYYECSLNVVDDDSRVGSIRGLSGNITEG